MALWKGMGMAFSNGEKVRVGTAVHMPVLRLFLGQGIEVGAGVVMEWALSLYFVLFFLKGSLQRPFPSECPSFYHHQLGAGV